MAADNIKKAHRPVIRDKYPLMVAATFLIYIFAFVFMVVFAVMAGPSIVAQSQPVEALPQVTVTDGTASFQSLSSTEYTTAPMENTNVQRGPLMLVNNDNMCHIDGINLKPLLENYNGTYQVANFDVSINGAVLDNMNTMFKDLQTAIGKNDVFVNSAYRDKDTQQRLYDEDQLARQNGEVSEDAEYVAPSTFSEHQSGYAFDLSLMDADGLITSYTGEGNYSWLNENCCKYGFVVRYPEGKTEYTGYGYEAWHFRYIGQPHAVYMVQHNLCLEEYESLLKTHTIDDPLYITDLSMKQWVVYYQPADAGDTTELTIPKNKEYQVSGNNSDGFIVTYQAN